jgi:SnoaL-like domain
MRRSLLISVIFTFCFFNFAMAARAEENAEDFMQMHNIEINWHKAQTTKNLDLMLSLFADDATLTAGGKTYTGKAQIKQLWEANPIFKPENQFVAYTPPARFKYDIDGNTGHVDFECIQLNSATNEIVPHSHVNLYADVIRVDGRWLIKDAKGTPLPKP